MTFTGASVVLERHMAIYRRSWRASVLSSFMLPMLGIVGFGVGVGSYVTGGLGGLTYREYVIPGLLCSATLFIAVGDSTRPVMSGFQWSRTYIAQASTSLSESDIIGGHLAFIALRAVLSSLSFLLVAALFGALHSLWALAVPPLVVLFALSFAAPTTAYSAIVTQEGSLSLIGRLVVTPLTLFTGVYFPIGFLPVPWRWLAYVSPLWHAVDLCRAAMTGARPSWSVAGHVLYLVLLSCVGVLVARVAFRRRLRK